MVNLKAKRGMKLAGRRLLDVVEGATGRRGPLMPPRHLMFDGTPRPQIYRSNGLEYLGHFKSLGGLSPTERVLDLGSGAGRKAVPLTGYLTSGTYHGIDPVRRGVEWCQRTITPRFPNFRFTHVDLYNGQYNPSGTVRPADVRFPIEDGSVDFVILSSVFTHMLPEDVNRYLDEIGRMLTPTGRAFVTWFLLNDETRTASRFAGSNGTYAVENPAVPEQAIAFEEPFVASLYERNGLRIVAPIHYGSWSGRPQKAAYQDIIVATPK